MSHREKGLTPHIIAGVPDSYKVPAALQKVMEALPTWPGPTKYPVYIPKSLYDRAKALGYDMTCYAITQPMPTGSGDIYCGGKHIGVNGSITIEPGSITRRGNPK